jgi:hypothetical protein
MREIKLNIVINYFSSRRITMSTTYDETPRFVERISGAPLIIHGLIEKAIEINVDQSIDPPQLQTIYRVRVDGVLKGQIDKKSLKLRVVGGKAEEIETESTVSIKVGDRVMLMLSPDYGPGQAKNMFVPYFLSCYVKLDEDTAKELVMQKIQIRDATVNLADLRSMVLKAMQIEEKQVADLTELEPAELREIPYGEIGEMPKPEPGGATSASPEGGEERSPRAD